MKKDRKGYLKKGIQNPRNAWYVVRANLEIIGSRIFFKNTAGFRHNMMGRETEKKLMQIKKEFQVRDPNNPAISSLKKNGFANLKYLFDENKLHQIITKYNKLIDDDDYSFIRSKTSDGNVSSRMINKAFEVFPEVKDLITEDIVKMIEDYYKSHFQIIHVMMWRTYHVPEKLNLEKEQYGSNWHCDGDNTTITTFYTNMTNVDESDGPLHFQSIDRTKELIKKGYKSRHDYNLSPQVLEDPDLVLKHTGSKGSTVWVNTQFCLHRAGIPEPGHYRDMLQLRFIPSEEALHNDWLDRCECNNDEISHNNLQK